MLKKTTFLFVLSLCLIKSAFSAIAPPEKLSNNLLLRFEKNLSQIEIKKLKEELLSLSGNAVPTLIEVLKESKYPEKNRWMAMFALADIMGEKAVPYIAEYTKHPDWFMRLAGLKVLLGLEQKTLGNVYANSLSDPSYVVRLQALENIRALSLNSLKNKVWNMLYDEQNYTRPKKNSSKKVRSELIKHVITVTGDLQNKDVFSHLKKMLSRKNYHDIFSELDYALEKISGKKSPQEKEEKIAFWQTIQVD